MEVIEKIINYKHASENFDIYPLGCIHAGSIHCAENDIKRVVETIKLQKNAYWIGMGDFCDAILKDDKRFDIEGLAPWVKKDNIVECQRQWLKELFKPIANKCICLLSGNHEETIHLHYQDDIVRNLCKDLDIPYGGYSCFINLIFRKTYADNIPPKSRQYIIHAWHGNGCAQTEGARIMRLMRLVNDIEADIYLMGHLHTMAQYTPDRLVCRSGRVKSVKLAAAITGSWLKTYTQPPSGGQLNPSYGEVKGYKPSRIGCPVLHIKPYNDHFTIES